MTEEPGGSPVSTSPTIPAAVKVALWGDHVELLQGLDLGYKAELIDALVKNGWNEGLELSCGWRTRITFAPPE